MKAEHSSEHGDARPSRPQGAFENRQGRGLRQSSGAFERDVTILPKGSPLATIRAAAKAAEDCRTPRRWRDGGRSHPFPRHSLGRALPIFSRAAVGAVWIALLLLLFPARAAEPASPKAAPLSIAAIQRATPVDFEKEILPILKNNCLACHNQTKAKASLILETPQSILKGGDSGPAVVPGKSSESLLLQAAAHQIESVMPPRDNKVAAGNLTPEELGLLKLWIDQGAKGDVRAAAPLEWKTIPQHLNPIYALALTAEGQFAACGRANQIFLYHLPSGQCLGRLGDPALGGRASDSSAPVAHRDMVHSLAFNPKGDLLASGDYRQVKLWRRETTRETVPLELADQTAIRFVTARRDGQWLAAAGEISEIELWQRSTGAKRRLDAGANVTAVALSPDGQLLAAASVQSLRVWKVADAALAVAKPMEKITAVAWLQQKALVTADNEGWIRVWEFSGKAEDPLTLKQEWKGHDAAVVGLASWDSETEFVSGSADGSVRHWKAATGERVRELKHGAPVVAVSARVDGKRFASAGGPVAKLWNAESGDVVAELKGDRYAFERVQERERELAFAASEIEYRKGAWKSAEDQHKSQTERVTKATEAFAAAEKSLAEKEKQVTAAKEAKAAVEKALADLKAELAKATEQFDAADKAAKTAIAEAQKAVETAALARVPADQAAHTQALSQKMAVDARAVADKTKAAADLESDSTKAAAQKLAAEADTLATKAKEVAETVAADAAAKSKLSAEAEARAAKAIENVAAKSFAAGQVKVLFDKLTAEFPDKEKKEKEKLASAAKALETAEKELPKAQLARSTSENELQLAKRALEQATAAVASAKSALTSAEEFRSRADATLQEAKTAAEATIKSILALAFSPDNRTVATAGEDQRIHTWSAETGAPFESYSGHKDRVLGVAFLGANEFVSAAADDTAFTWRAFPAWKLERAIGTGDTLSPIAGRVTALRFTPDGEFLATGSGEPSRSGEVKLWRVADGTLVREFHNAHSDEVFSLDFTADGQFLASGAADKFVRVSEVATGKVVKSFEGHTHHVLSVSWKRDGRTLASAGADNVIKIWDFVAGERKKNIDGFNKEVTAVSFIGISDQAIAASGDSQVRAIKENGDRVRAFEGATDFVYSAAATPDGKVVIAGGLDSILRVWDGQSGKVVATFAAAAE